ncbi:hypothetical protein GAYE_SCF13G3388 [Galdieria yellowstonensis]|uniref:Reverse transcriptase domain-containing protein n=1 Tax=Galdieria yellowstonensis TaxID=3028027 RepID=A0AAV9IDB8_9RHOD|nr:hypothetical protein GAYE_SCF13G3388 [Galdieria yellowstonensis]
MQLLPIVSAKRSKAHSILVRERAGIRTRQECAAQVTALVECVQRRWNKEMRPSYGCFIDLRKAFDRVPHEALFRKLEGLDIRGRCLEFYCGLYHTLAGLSRSLHARAKYRAVIHGCVDKLVGKRIYFATSNPALWAMIVDGNSNFA